MTVEIDGETAIQIWPCSPKKVALAEVDAGSWRAEKFVPGADRSSYPPPDLLFMAAAIRRVAPWVPAVWLVPRLVDEGGKVWSGVHFCRDSAIIVSFRSLTVSPESIYHTLHHELFHAVQQRVGGKFLKDLEAEIGKKTNWFGDDYLDDPSEQTARVYEYLVAFLERGERFSCTKKTGSGVSSTRFIAETLPDRFWLRSRRRRKKGGKRSGGRSGSAG